MANKQYGITAEEHELQKLKDKLATEEMTTPASDSTTGRFKECRQCCAEVRDGCHELGQRCSNFNCGLCMKKTCSPDNVKRKVPIAKWLPKYRLKHFQGDLIAGLTVGLTVIPQGIAYANIAELPPQYGLYSAFMGCFVYCVFGTSKDITLGPTAIMSLMTAEFGHSPKGHDATVAIILTLFCGVTQLLMGLLNLGFLVDFISHPVINSFTTAAAITIAFGQIKTWLGLKNIPRDFIHQFIATFENIPNTQIWDFVMGLVCMILLYGMKRMKNYQWRETADLSVGQKIWRKTVWLLGTARNAIVVMVAAAVLGTLLHFDIDVFTQTDNIDGGLPEFKVPEFFILPDNHTFNSTWGPSEIFDHIGAGFGIIPLIGLVETIAIGKAFSRKNCYNIDASQELIAIGASNIVGSFIGSYPVTGSFSRTAVNSQSGVMTPAGGLWTGALVLLALGVLTPLFKYIPSAALAGVIIMAVLDMVDFSLLLKLWRVKRIDLLPWITCFIFSFVLGIEYGILLGVGVSLLILLYPWARPNIKVKDEFKSSNTNIQVSQREVTVLQMDQGLRFPGVEYLQESVLKHGLHGDVPKSIVLDMTHIASVDYTSLQHFQALIDDFTRNNILLVFSNIKPSILAAFMKIDLRDFRFAASNDDAIRLIYDESEPMEENPEQGLLNSARKRDHVDRSRAGSVQSTSSQAVHSSDPDLDTPTVAIVP